VNSVQHGVDALIWTPGVHQCHGVGTADWQARMTS